MIRTLVLGNSTHPRGHRVIRPRFEKTRKGTQLHQPAEKGRLTAVQCHSEASGILSVIRQGNSGASARSDATKSGNPSPTLPCKQGREDYASVANLSPSFTDFCGARFGASSATPFGHSTITVDP